MALYPETTKIYYHRDDKKEPKVVYIGRFPEKMAQSDAEAYIYKRKSIYGNLDVDALMNQSPGILASAQNLTNKAASFKTTSQ
jgi:hypothetical protein